MFNNLGLVFFKLKNNIKVRKYCNLVLEIDPGNAKALYRRAHASYKEKKWEEAEEDLRRAADISPQDTAIPKLLVRVAEGKKKGLEKKK